MSVRSFSGRQGELRIYDGTPGTPKYVSIKFVLMNFSAPLAKSRGVEPVVTTVGGYVHAPTGPDYEQNLYEPSSLSFSFWVNSDDWSVHRNAFSNMDMKTPWTVGSGTWQSTKARGSIILFDNSYIPTQPFYDQKKKAVDVQVKWTDRPISGSIVGMRYDETYFAPQNMTINEQPDFVEVRVNGALCYGNIEPIGDFSPGTSSI